MLFSVCHCTAFRVAAIGGVFVYRVGGFRGRAYAQKTLRLSASAISALKTKKRFASNSPILHLFTAKTDSFPSLHVLHVFCTFYTLLHFVVLKILNKKGSCGLTIRIFSIHMVNDFSHNFAKMFENIFSEKA